MLSECKSVFGCYIHGLFDSTEFLESFIEGLFEKRGVVNHDFNIVDPDAVYEQLADAIEEHIDLSKLR